MEPRPYDTDLSDEQFALIEPFLPRPKKMGRPPADPSPTPSPSRPPPACRARLLPPPSPPGPPAPPWHRRWRTDGTWERINEALRQQVRLQAGRDPSPRSSAADSQSVKTTPQG